MKRSTVVKSLSLPTRSPIGFASLNWLLLDCLDAPGWSYGVLWTLVVQLGLYYIISLRTESKRDVPGFRKK